MRDPQKRCQKRKVRHIPERWLHRFGNSLDIARPTSHGEKSRYWLFFFCIQYNDACKFWFILFYCFPTLLLAFYLLPNKGKLFSWHPSRPCPCLLSSLVFLHFPSYLYSHLAKPLGAELLTFVSSCCIWSLILQSPSLVDTWLLPKPILKDRSRVGLPLETPMLSCSFHILQIPSSFFSQWTTSISYCVSPSRNHTLEDNNMLDSSLYLHS